MRRNPRSAVFAAPDVDVRGIGGAVAKKASEGEMTNPFLLTKSSVISFSGGRTSGMMLKLILDAHGGTLPDNAIVTFANTGREMPQTLDFVQECSERWNVPIVWLEFDLEAEGKTAVVNYNTASRNGEPFTAVIRWKQMLPTVMMRFCTIELKIRRQQAYARQAFGSLDYDAILGLRADEGARVKKALGTGIPRNRTPLYFAGLTKRDVIAFWSDQEFDLRLESVNGVTPAGNCDLCFLKGKTLLAGLMARYPKTARWWIEREQEAGAECIRKGRSAEAGRFRRSQDYASYAEQFDTVQRQGDLLEGWQDVENIDCIACTD